LEQIPGNCIRIIILLTAQQGTHACMISFLKKYSYVQRSGPHPRALLKAQLISIDFQH
jgi:hypothetical protein